MTIRNYSDAAAYLAGGRSKDERPVQNNTRLIRRSPETIAVRLHETDVVTYRKNGTIVLNSGGWLTPTTKDRINSYSPVRIWQAKGIWWIGDSLFYNGMVVDKDGKPFNPRYPDKNTMNAEKKTMDRINRYIDGFSNAMNSGLPDPDGGDCWFCLMQLEDDDHLKSHIKENYFVPSLLMNALRERGYRFPEVIFQMENRSGRTDSSRRALRKYLKARLTPGIAR